MELDCRTARISTPLIPFWGMPLPRLASTFHIRRRPSIGA
jgi:hypothetical protein